MRKWFGIVFMIFGLVLVVSGLVVSYISTLPATAFFDPSGIVSLMKAFTDLIMQLLSVSWTPTRVGILSVCVGMVFSFVGAWAVWFDPAELKQLG